MQYVTTLKYKNPVYRDMHGKYYFYDEDYINSFGPFNTREKAEKEYDKYIRDLNGEL